VPIQSLDLVSPEEQVIVNHLPELVELLKPTDIDSLTPAIIVPPVEATIHSMEPRLPAGSLDELLRPGESEGQGDEPEPAIPLDHLEMAFPEL
jgi:hypothetical protein